MKTFILGAALLCVSASHAQQYPTKPVRLVVPFAPGGASDALARMAADKLGRSLGQSFVVENRAGAAGIIGSDLVAKSPPDGYSLVISGIGSHVVAPVVAKAPFDPMASFTHIALLGGPPTGLAVFPGVQARTVSEFVALSKSTPGGLSYGSAGPGTHSHLVSELFKQRTGANLVHVPYKGAGPAMTDVMAGHLPMTFSGTVALPHVRAGKLRFLAITSERRLKDIPDVPTFAEIGLKDLTTTVWFGLSGPAGMPRDVVGRVNVETRNALLLPDVRERLAAEGIEPNTLDSEGFTAFVRSEIERWTPIARAVAAETKK
jgi:tripartite-type tricarboxylate transporter receptor subunit TctC